MAWLQLEFALKPNCKGDDINLSLTISIRTSSIADKPNQLQFSMEYNTKILPTGQDS